MEWVAYDIGSVLEFPDTIYTPFGWWIVVGPDEWREEV